MSSNLPFRKGGNKGGGGYLNDVSGAIQRIGFKAGKSGENKNGPWTAYSIVVEFLPDGAEKTAVQFLDAGFLRGNLTISEDGNTIEGSDSYALDTDTPGGAFIESLVVGEGTRLPEELLGDLRDYDAVAGARVTLLRTLDQELTRQAGFGKLLKAEKTTAGKKKLQDALKDGSMDEKFITAGKRYGKTDGKEDKKKGPYMLDKLTVKEVLAVPEEGAKPVAAKKVAGKPAAKPAAAATKAAPKAETTSDVDLDLADSILADFAASKPVVEVKGVSNAVIKKWMGKDKPEGNRESYRTFMSSAAYLKGAEERGVIVLSEDGKTLSAAA